MVSSCGRYYNPKKGVIARGHLHPSGYRLVEIAGYKWPVHQVVLITFNGLPPNHETWQMNHKDGDKANNRLDNLDQLGVCHSQSESIALSCYFGQDQQGNFEACDVEASWIFGKVESIFIWSSSRGTGHESFLSVKMLSQNVLRERI